MVTKLKPAGDGAVVYLERHLLDLIGVTEDAPVIVWENAGSIVVTPLRPLPEREVPYKSTVRISLEGPKQSVGRPAEQIKKNAR